jgi:hypothetical protein
MRARADQEIQVLRTVVHRVKTPQEGALVHPTMSPGEPEIADHERDQATQPDRPLANLVVRCASMAGFRQALGSFSARMACP